MLGVLTTILFGCAAISEWCNEDQAEQENRKHSKNHNLSTYIDKWGHERYTSTGKRKTDLDYHRELNEQIEEVRKDFCLKQSQKKEKQLEEIRVYRNKYEENLNIYLKKYGLSFEEYFFATHKTELLFKNEIFVQFANVSEESIKKICRFRVQCHIVPKSYL